MDSGYNGKLIIENKSGVELHVCVIPSDPCFDLLGTDVSFYTESGVWKISSSAHTNCKLKIIHECEGDIAPNPEHRKIQPKKLKWQLYLTNGVASLVIMGLFYTIVWVATS